MNDEYKPEVFMLKNIFPGYFGYFYPKDILWEYKDNSFRVTKTLVSLSRKYCDLEFFDKRIIKKNDFKGILCIEGCVGLKKPMVDWIEIYDHHQYKVIPVGGDNHDNEDKVLVASEN
jgi:hypothetical protein